MTVLDANIFARYLLNDDKALSRQAENLDAMPKVNLLEG